MEENKTNNVQQIAGAIIIAGIIIGGAILLKGNTGGSTPIASASTAKAIGLNVKKFNTCVESGKFKAKVQADIDDGNKAGVSGTPSSFIVKNGMVVDRIGGAQPFEKVIQQVGSALENTAQPIAAQIRPITPDDHIVGDPNAEIIIVEYSDLDCPFCKTFHRTMYEVVEKSEGRVAWVYRHYPLPQLHPNAFRKAEETECAWEQGGNEAFWKYTDTLFGVAK
jgi:protein-disulfide isomerase